MCLGKSWSLMRATRRALLPQRTARIKDNILGRGWPTCRARAPSIPTGAATRILVGITDAVARRSRRFQD